jgi:hypothetical protein
LTGKEDRQDLLERKGKIESRSGKKFFDRRERGHEEEILRD